MREKYASILFKPLLFGIFWTTLQNLILLSYYAILRTKPVLCQGHDHSIDQDKLNSPRRIYLLALCQADWSDCFQTLFSSLHLYLAWPFIWQCVRTWWGLLTKFIQQIECLLYSRHCIRLQESSESKTAIVSVLAGLTVWCRKIDISQRTHTVT